MAELIKTSMTILVTGSIFAGLGIWIEQWFVKSGISRGRTMDLLIVAFIGVFIKQMWYSNATWWIFAPAILLALTLGVHRGDLWMTMQRGRWWWKAEE